MNNWVIKFRSLRISDNVIIQISVQAVVTVLFSSSAKICRYNSKVSYSVTLTD